MICLNGRPTAVPNASMRLLDWIREYAGDFAPKEGCAAGHCGACTVLFDGQPALSCCMLAIVALGRDVRTASELVTTDIGRVLQDKFTEHGAFQCGFCAPGIVAAAVGWLRSRDNRSVSRMDAANALSGNLCRCTGYEQIIDALVDAAEFLGGIR
jgi:aerobic carbon-monoxide dehydrogenase small subunit